ncbi:ComEC/Rec2 family competence protein [Paraflavitalea sp. CAU 1676]|uniref:ComEC/Rec2 family competence protein n=1 Tax=Paraflavitalea sp. CAU 1676 TaxID=3032598 RepID=UPI0023DCD3C3|nr:ComEC/Rec2 family competence protein [Paraflavitalea sp. CAU 1676]MDF2193606.1 ComEC/Rec2 family competence protein [Paraflavitalea sp. CAU 1676]
MRFPRILDWKEAPFLRILIPFTAGIFFQTLSPIAPLPAWLLAVGCITVLALLSRTSTTLLYRYQSVQGALINLLLFSTGILLCHYKDPQHRNDWFAHHIKTSDTLLVDIEEPLTEKARSYSTTATIIALVSNKGLQPVNGRLLLYFSKEGPLPQIDNGSRLLIVKSPESIQPSGNPFAFDYQQYCSHQKIWHQVYLREDNYKLAAKRPGNTVKKVLLDTRKKMLGILRENIPDKKHAGLAEALLIGYKEDLDRPLLQSYINTGIVHIIAVSGMHLALIYGILLMIGRQLPTRWRRWPTLLIILTTLWAFAFLTGASPSVLRAAIMFTCLLIGRELPVRHSLYNALAISAFLLLWYDPWLCFDVGFQLSYAAVFGILLFNEPVYRLFVIKNRLLNQVWKLISLTLAAQILTLPLCLYHFHQFPNLFLLTNLVAVPLSSLILLAELALTAVFFWPPVAHAIGWVITQLIGLLNQFVEYVDRIPFNTTQNIPCSLSQALLLYILIAMITWWWLGNRKHAVYPALAATWLLALTAGMLNWIASRQQAFVVYNIPGRQAVDFLAGQQYQFVGDTALTADARFTSLFLQPNRTARRVKPAGQLSCLLNQGNLSLFGPRSLLRLDGKLHGRLYHRNKPLSPSRRLPIDFILLSNNPDISIKELIALFDCSYIIIDATNSYWKTKSWTEDSRLLGVICHAVATQGAFVFTLH